MYLTYIYASPAHAEPTHRCASNAPNSPAHTRIFVSHKTKASTWRLKCTSELCLPYLSLSKIRDRSTEGNGRPHRTAVFDF